MMLMMSMMSCRFFVSAFVSSLGCGRVIDWGR